MKMEKVTGKSHASPLLLQLLLMTAVLCRVKRFYVIPGIPVLFEESAHFLAFFGISAHERTRKNGHKGAFYLPRQYLSLDYGRICYEGFSA